jgi:hypothetical protein
MKFIRTILNKFITNDKKVLGRWSIESCDKKMNSKIDLSNEDHCGPCGQYALNKTITDFTTVKKKIETIDSINNRNKFIK